MSQLEQPPVSDDADAVDLEGAWCLHPQVAIRHESFGALAYHFGTRRLSFLKSPTLRTVVESLSEHPTARAALAGAGLGEQQLPAYTKALAILAESGMIVRRETL